MEHGFDVVDQTVLDQQRRRDEDPVMQELLRRVAMLEEGQEVAAERLWGEIERRMRELSGPQPEPQEHPQPEPTAEVERELEEESSPPATHGDSSAEDEDGPQGEGRAS